MFLLFVFWYQLSISIISKKKIVTDQFLCHSSKHFMLFPMPWLAGKIDHHITTFMWIYIYLKVVAYTSNVKVHLFGGLRLYMWLTFLLFWQTNNYYTFHSCFEVHEKFEICYWRRRYIKRYIYKIKCILQFPRIILQIYFN